jgi:hypothetical protein
MDEATEGLQQVEISPVGEAHTCIEETVNNGVVESTEAAPAAPPTPPPKPAHLKPNVSKKGIVEMLRQRGLTKTWKPVFLCIDGVQARILKLNDQRESTEKLLEECNLADGAKIKVDGESFEISGPNVAAPWKLKAANSANSDEWKMVIERGIEQAHDRHEADQKNIVRALIGDQTGSSKRNSKRNSVLHSKRSASASTTQNSSQFSSSLKTVASFREFGGGADAKIVAAVGSTQPPANG